jgi:cell wall-associated NlpC family hydrolase
MNANRVSWSRIRAVEAAKKWIGLPYKHHHIPAMGGMDCSNFTAFVYNYAFGIRFSSWVERQSEEAGRKLEKSETLAPGDLIFLYSADFTRISHAVIYLSPDEIIDSTGPGVDVRPFRGWYKKNYAWARRVIE